MNNVEKRFRDEYLTKKMKEPKRIDLTMYEDWEKLWKWVVKQEWWERPDFLRYLGKDKDLPNAIYHYLKDIEKEL